MTRATRILAVTAGLVVAGAVFGAVAGAVAFGIVVLLARQTTAGSALGMLAFPAFFGAVIGAVAAPTAGWLLLRTVPLGRAVGWTTLGAVTGGMGGWLLATGLGTRFTGHVPVLGNAIEAGTVGAVIGFVAAALLARRRSRRHGPSSPAETPVVK
jgi:hypothetical protein